MRLVTAVLAIAVAVAAFGVAVRLYMGRAGEDRLRAGEGGPVAAIAAVPANGFLACPPGYCAAAAASPSPVFGMPPDRLLGCWRRMIAGERNVVPIAMDPAQRRLVYIQHTPLLRFPDIVTVEFVALARGRSSVAIYSHSRYGRGDLGTNRKRVVGWLRRLSAAAGSGGC